MKKKAVLWIVPFLLYVALLGVMPQMEPDEVRYSLIASAMNETGSYVTPKSKIPSTWKNRRWFPG